MLRSKIRYFTPSSRFFCSWNGLTCTQHHIPCIDPSTNQSYSLHLYQIQRTSNLKSSSDPVCFLLHGGVENGKIFYSKSGKGFGPYLARLGYNIFIADLRGKGESKPSIKDDPLPHYGIKDITSRTIPTFLNYIRQLTRQEQLCWISHSIGGVLMKSSLARDPQLLNSIKCEIHFGTKRLISQRNWMNYLILDVFYGQICRIIFKIHGYLPAKLYRIGSDDDTYQAYATAYHWIHPQTNKWIDLEDNFPYGAEYSKHILQSSSTPSSRVSSLPPALVFTSSHDILATPKDVEHWCHEVGIPVCNIVKLCDEKYRYQQYNHFTMLTHPSCEKDHFQLVKQFLNKYLPSPGHSLPPSD